MSEQESFADSVDPVDGAVGAILGSLLREEANRESVPNSTPIQILIGRSKKEHTKMGRISASLVVPAARHWAVRVGDFVWEMFKNQDDTVIMEESKWLKAKRRFSMQFQVGKTTLDTAIIRNKAQIIISKMPEYKVLSDNCQTFAIALSNEIKCGEKWMIRLAVAFNPVFPPLTRPPALTELMGEGLQAIIPLGIFFHGGLAAVRGVKRIYALLDRDSRKYEEAGALVPEVAPPEVMDELRDHGMA